MRRPLGATAVAVAGLVPLQAVWWDGPAQRRAAVGVGLVVLVTTVVLAAGAARRVWGGLIGPLLLALAWAVGADVGRGPVLVSVLAAWCAHLSVADGVAGPRPGARESGVAVLALLPLVGAEVSWWATESAPLACLLLALTAAVVLAHRRRPDLLGPLDETARRPLRWLVVHLGLDQAIAGAAARLRAGVRWLRGPKDRADRWFVLAIVVGAAARLGWGLAMARSPLGAHPSTGDWWGTWNLHFARQIAGGDAPSLGGIPTAYWAPGYPAVLAPVVRLAEATGWFAPEVGAAALNALLGTASIALAGFLAGRWWPGGRARNLAAWGLALAPGQVFATSGMVAEPLLVLLLLGVVLAISVIVHGRAGAARARALVTVGFVVGASLLVRETASFLVVVPALAIRAVDRSWRGALRCTASLLLGIAIALAPWAVRNGVQVGWWSPSATSTTEGLCALQFDGHRFTDRPGYAPADVAESYRECERHSPFDTDDPRLDTTGLHPDGWVVGGPDEVRWARENVDHGIGHLLGHPLDVVAAMPRRLVETLGEDQFGGLDLGTQYGRLGLLSDRQHRTLVDLANLWHYGVVALAVLGVAGSRRVRRAAPVWFAPLAVLAYPLLSGYAYSRHFFAGAAFTVVLAAGTLAELRGRASSDERVDEDDSDRLQHAEHGDDEQAGGGDHEREERALGRGEPQQVPEQSREVSDQQHAPPST